MRTRSLLLLAVAVCAAATAAARGASALIVGSWDPIRDIYDPHVQELGSWAVAEHVKQAPGDAGLTFRRVTSGETQEFDGMNYRLVLLAGRGGGDDGSYTAQVLEQDWINSRTLVSFIPSN
ncbi:putative cysteine proteinase inhibitor 7 [Oryza brachyantha]|uniref:Cysteine proteinase inhibitor n=1 Tax=Oryza brachyantha TaxID=4533 RepID=J3LLA1_ORYBR|nr:putative cysteine proteinase inhibitor 7 [Oryza brachyantha]